MVEILDVDQHRSSPPSLLNTLTELPRLLVELSVLFATMPSLTMLPKGDQHRVLVLPGFMAGDESTFLLRAYLRHMGYQPETWNLGRNNGRPELLQVGLMQRLDELMSQDPSRISIIGQSLGGVFGREVGRLHPDKIRQVITLGSPFGAQNSESSMKMVTALFEKMSGLSVEEMREFIDAMDPTVSPPIPVTAIYSKGDGVVHWTVCREAEEDDHTQNIRVCGSHCGMAMNSMTYYIIANRLAQKDGHWVPFTSPFTKPAEVTAHAIGA